MPEFDRDFHADAWSQTIIDYPTNTGDGTVSLDDLIDHIIDQERNAVASDRETVTYEVVHVCLPTLVENGVVEYNERTETINYRPPAEQ